MSFCTLKGMGALGALGGSGWVVRLARYLRHSRLLGTRERPADGCAFLSHFTWCCTLP